MKIWIINPFDSLPGESLRPGRYAFMGELLSQRGHKVTWWSSNFFHTTKTVRCKTQKTITVNNNFKIICLKTPSYRKNVSIKRVLNHLVYGFRFFRNAYCSLEKPDIILASVPPLSSAKIATLLSKRVKGIKCVIDIQDLWPEFFENLFPPKIRFLSKVIFYPLKILADSIYEASDAIIGVSTSCIKRGIEPSNYNKKNLMLPICIDISHYRSYDNDVINQWGKKEKEEFWAIYIGTIANTYDVSTILDTAKLLLKTYPKIKFFIAGVGPELERLKLIKEKRELNNVIFTGFLPLQNLVPLLKKSDVALNTCINESLQTIPNKLFDYMLYGLPIINSRKGEIENLLKKENIGIQYEPANCYSLKGSILELYHNREKRELQGQNARKLVEEKFDKKKEYLKLEEFLKDLVSETDQQQVNNKGS